MKGPGSGSLKLTGRIRPSAPIAPASTDALTLELRDSADVLFAATLSHPASDPWWKRKGGMTRYLNKGAFGSLGTVTLRTLRSDEVEVQLRGKGLAFSGLDEPLLRPRLVIGDQCFVSDLAGRCVADPKKLRCR